MNYAKTYFTGAFPKFGFYALGALFVLVTLFLPRGIIGLIRAKRRKSNSALRYKPRARSRRENEAPDKTLQLEKLTVSFDGFKALNDLTLHVEPASCAASSAPTAQVRPP